MRLGWTHVFPMKEKLDTHKGPAVDGYNGAEVSLPFGGTMHLGKVNRRAKTTKGELTGTQNDSPNLVLEGN